MCGRLGFAVGAASARLHTRPIDVRSTSRCAQEYFIGDNRVCARLADGSYRCRGQNTFAESTHGNWPGLPPPSSHCQAFPGPWEQLTLSSSRSCATRAGRLWCWGQNRGAFRAAGPEVVDEPVLVEGVPPDVVGIDIGGIDICTLHRTGQVQCKAGASAFVSYPNLPKGVEEIAAVAATVLCLRTRDEVWCHGGEPWALEGGDPSGTASIFSPKPWKLVKIEGIPGPLRSMSVRCVLNEAGEVWCWGRNSMGQWGDGTAARDCDNGCPGWNLRAARRARVPKASQIASSGGQTCAVTHDGAVWCWGESAANQRIDLPQRQLLPGKVELLGSDKLRVYAGNQWCVEKQDHRLLCWGSTDYLQIADKHLFPIARIAR